MSPLRYALGCPFWSFGDWNGSLFSKDARPGDRLRQYARVFNTVEGNTTFYSTPSARTATRWAEEVPAGFRFCFKLPQAVTHERMLRDANATAASFFQALEPLRDHLGPFLVQLPAAFGPGQLIDLEKFLDVLPGELTYAVELRHPAFFEDESLAQHLDEILAARGCDRVMMDTRALRAGDSGHPEVVAALHKKPDLPLRPEPIGSRPFVRFVGHPNWKTNAPYVDEWAERVARWIDRGLEPFFFVHTASNLQTPAVAADLHQRIGSRVPVGELPPFPGEQGERANGQLALL